MKVLVDGIEFGERYRDRYTTFEGTASAVWVKEDGTVQVALTYLDTVPKDVWVPADRLDLVDRDPLGRPGFAGGS
jgi:hypothetical protein